MFLALVSTGALRQAISSLMRQFGSGSGPEEIIDSMRMTY